MLGPGSIEQAHQPDEFIDMAFIELTRELMGQLIENFCLVQRKRNNKNPIDLCWKCKLQVGD